MTSLCDLDKGGAEMSNLIAQNVSTFYNYSLPKTGKPLQEGEKTTLGAIVKITDGNQIEVVSLATGTKCLGQKDLCPHGYKLTDSHAEVLARRAFILYLYNQMELLSDARNQTKSIFLKIPAETDEKPPDNVDEDKLLMGIHSLGLQYKLKENITFHFFISQMPCGDASIISNPSSIKEDEEKDTDGPEAKKPKLNNDQETENDGVHRTGAKLLAKIEAGGDYYEKIQEIGLCRVKPGKGNQTLSMSCSDKIAKWNLLGLQGSLLTNFIRKPIRFSSIIIGSSVPFSAESMERAIYTRIEKKLSEFPHFQTKFTPNPIKIYQSDCNFMEKIPENGSPAPCSIIFWRKFISSIKPPVIFPIQVSVNGIKQGTIKKHKDSIASSLDISRVQLAKKFCSFLSQNKSDNASGLVEICKNMKYEDFKKINRDYCKDWTYIKENILKGWTQKPNLQDFKLN